MTTLAPSGAPPSALKIWSNGHDIFVEIPGRHGPIITSYLHNHHGIAEVFSLLGVHRVDYDYASSPVPAGYSTPTKLPSPADALAESILMKLGIIPKYKVAKR